ncbi:MAG: DEAD/DEAH box helicase, partial [Sphaerochaetaceae bacterium]|nr:DEAD/DEAH box helicase [Sphaerochaetaceae bacterium]
MIEEEIREEEREDVEENGFASLGLSEVTLAALEEKGFTTPTEIQAACIPLLLEGSCDVVGQAQTGTGKTAAFALPILEKINEKDRSTQALILAPTRELAIQTAKEIESLKGDRKITVDAIYGGASYENQFRKLRSGLQIVVGTPGRIQDHLDRKTLDISKIKFCVLDEADEMLDMGFVEDIEKILKTSPEDKKMLLFSATMPQQILHLAESFMRDYQIKRIKKSTETATNTEQFRYDLRESDKIEALTRIIDREADFYGVIFCRTKVQCEEIGRKLQERGYNAEALHGDLSQKQREIILQKMKDHRISILVATDVAARGLDIQDLTHVINFTIPQDPEVYIHRIGRTGRAGKSGIAITFVTSKEKRKFAFIERVAKSNIKQGTIPTADEIIAARKERIIKAVNEALLSPTNMYAETVEKLLETIDAVALSNTLMKMLYGRYLDGSQYHSIRALEKKQRSEKAVEAKQERVYRDDEYIRLFIARGRKDGLTKGSLANILIEQCHVKDQDLQGIQVMEEFSFVNSPARVAEHILKVFENRLDNGKPLIVKARPEKDGKSSSRDKKPSIKEAPRKKSNTATRQIRSRRRWEDEAQPYGRDRRYDDDDDFSFSRRGAGRFKKP